jgi:hypothetical protein
MLEIATHRESRDPGQGEDHQHRENEHRDYRSDPPTAAPTRRRRRCDDGVGGGIVRRLHVRWLRSNRIGSADAFHGNRSDDFKR